jgi:hypothetical protein
MTFQTGLLRWLKTGFAGKAEVACMLCTANCRQDITQRMAVLNPTPFTRVVAAYHHAPSPPIHPQVSTTRLAIRNIPASWDEAKLKAAFIAGVKARATKEKPVVKQVTWHPPLQHMNLWCPAL